MALHMNGAHMFKLATPISHLFEDPAAAKAIMAASDCLECREHTHDSRAPRQWLFHFDIQLIHLWGGQEQDFIRAALAAREELKVVSFHMATVCSQPVLRDGMYQGGGEKFSREQMFGYARQNAQWLRKTLSGRDIKIAVENNNYYPTEAYQEVTDADFISRIVKDNDLMFLFDLAHARITAHNKGLNYEDYLAGLPLSRMIQIHVSKHRVNDKNLAVDAHVLPDEAVLREAEGLVRRYEPEYLTLEYYQDKENLIKLLKQYKQLGSTLAK